MWSNTAPETGTEMAGPTRAEAIRDALMVLRADYSRVFTKQRAVCHDCNGAGFLVGDKPSRDKREKPDNDSDGINECHSCAGVGFVLADTFDSETVPDELRPFITGFKTGPGGTILPDMRGKDKSADALIKMIGNGWSSEFPRDAFGADAPVEAVPALDSKEALIAQYSRIATVGDPTVAMAAMREIAKLRGFITEDDESIDKTALTLADVSGLFGKLLNANGRKTADQNAAGDEEEEILPE